MEYNRCQYQFLNFVWGQRNVGVQEPKFIRQNAKAVLNHHSSSRKSIGKDLLSIVLLPERVWLHDICLEEKHHLQRFQRTQKGQFFVLLGSAASSGNDILLL